MMTLKNMIKQTQINKSQLVIVGNNILAEWESVDKNSINKNYLLSLCWNKLKRVDKDLSELLATLKELNGE